MANGLLPQIVVQVLAVVSGSVITVGVPLILTKLNKFSKVYTTLFGVEDVESMGGIVGVVEVHDGEIDRLTENMDKIEHRVSKLEEACKRRKEAEDTTYD